LAFLLRFNFKIEMSMESASRIEVCFAARAGILRVKVFNYRQLALTSSTEYRGLVEPRFRPSLRRMVGNGGMAFKTWIVRVATSEF
jgi:hypothetical protein